MGKLDTIVIAPMGHHSMGAHDDEEDTKDHEDDDVDACRVAFEDMVHTLHLDIKEDEMDDAYASAKRFVQLVDDEEDEEEDAKDGDDEARD